MVLAFLFWFPVVLSGLMDWRHFLSKGVACAHKDKADPGRHHPGGNVINPDEPIRGSSTLNSTEAFIAVIRKPKKPMPAFSPVQISDENARQLYLYITNVLAKSDKRGGER